MVRVHFEIVNPSSEGSADVLRIPLALAVVHDFHRVLAGRVRQWRACLRVDRVDPEIGRYVAIQQVELEVDQDRLFVLHLEPEPVEPGLPLRLIFEVVDVVARAIDVASRPQLVRLLPRVVGLGLDGRAIAGSDFQMVPRQT